MDSSKGMIEVRVHMDDVAFNKPDEYFNYIEKRLKLAGVPVDGDTLKYGTLVRRDDPADFGVSIWSWSPN